MRSALEEALHAPATAPTHTHERGARFTTVEQALQDIADGGITVVVDGERRTITVADLIAYRSRRVRVERVVSTAMPTVFGSFTAVGYRSLADNTEHVALVKGNLAGADDVLVHVHVRCPTGDVFHSLLCDCGTRLDQALAAIEGVAAGVLLYLAHDDPDDLGTSAHILADLGVSPSTGRTKVTHAPPS